MTLEADPHRASETRVRSARRTQQQRRETTRRLLLDAAIDCLCEVGLAGATLTVITVRARVTRGAIQHHFGTRDELLIALIEELTATLCAKSEKAVFADKAIAERLAGICEQYWAIVSSRHFIAAIQILLGTLHDPVLHPRILNVMGKAETELDRLWLELFGDYAIDHARLVATRHLAFAAFRGLIVRQMYRGRNDAWKAERALLLKMLQQALGSK